MTYFRRPTFSRGFWILATLFVGISLPIWFVLTVLSLGMFRGLELWADTMLFLERKLDRLI